MSDLTQGQKDACRKTSAYYAAHADGKTVEVSNGSQPLQWVKDFDVLDTTAQQFEDGTLFRIIEPPKLRPYRADELHELLGVKMENQGRKGVFFYNDTNGMEGYNLFKNCTFFDGPNAGKPVGKVEA
jgi:hypothetical protein